MKRGLERRLESRRPVQALQLGRGLVGALLQIRIDEVLDRVRKFVPHELAVFARGILSAASAARRLP